jgi:sec-independent protein translocase protein TatB
VRKFGKTYGEFKKMTTGFQSELRTALDEPMREMRETADAFRKAANFEFEGDDESAPAVDETKPDEPADAAGNVPSIAPSPDPKFTSAAPQKPDVIEAVDETAPE